MKTKHDNSQDIPPPELDAYLSRLLSPVRRSGDEYEPTTLRGIYIASVKRYLKTLRYSESTIEGQRSTVEFFERHLFKRISQFRDDTVVQWRVATLPNLIRIRLIDKCYSSHLRRKFNLEQEGTVTLDCLLMNTDK